MSDMEARLSRIERIVLGNGELGLTGRTTMIEKYIETRERDRLQEKADRNKERADRRKAMYSLWVGVVLLAIQIAVTIFLTLK